jgi:hypothetical protein
VRFPTTSAQPIGSPAAQVDGPLVDDLVAGNDVEALVLRDRRVDVRRHQLHLIADVHVDTLTATERGVLV